MAPNKGVSASKAASKAAKKAKQADKAAKKESQALKSVAKKGKGKLEDEEDDLEAILAKYQAEMAANSTASVTTLEVPPPPRTGALLLPSPSTVASEPGSNHLYLLFGEYFDGSRATFYNSTLRYDIQKDEWREYKSAEMPAPRSSAAGVCAPNLGEGGGILIFGGEYASPTQTSFHHYKDLWLFSIKTHLWSRIDTKKGPSARSGHRMVMWRQYILLFGGFVDVGVKTNYLSDLWVFDTEHFKWKQIDNLDKDRAPGPRSGFSFIPCPEGAILHGGYRKEYIKGTRPKGVPLEDTWLLRMDSDLTKLKWEKRKKVGYAPSLRSGCSMTHWANKGMGVLFGGVLDEEKDEESMESTFYNDLFAYNPAANGRWVSLNLKKRKKPGARRRIKKDFVPVAESPEMDVDGEEDDEAEQTIQTVTDTQQDDEAEDSNKDPTEASEELGDDPDDPSKSVPLTRYNAMLAIVKNTLFIYGGIYETTEPAREYTLDDFVTLNLEKLDRFNHIRGTGLEELEWQGSSDEDGESDSSDGQEDDSEDEDEEDDPMGEEEEEGEDAKEARHAALTPAEKDVLRQTATRYMGVARDTTRSEEEILSTPLPGEKLRNFFDRSRKALRREGFELASVKYAEYKPVLEEIERIQKEAEVEASTTKRGMGTAAIDQASIHHLHSGQVVLDLQGCLKELLENAYDSGATQVDVRIRDHGLEGVEVSDNGSGIKEEDWAYIGLKHHTSKLPDLDALPLVQTFGFRGEALSALCALSESVTITTATKETAPMGAIIKLARDGSVLDSTARVARPRGTTVAITGLFEPLPVRRKEFERTAKREYTKALSLLTAYALVPSAASTGDRPGVRLKVEHLQAGKANKRNTVLITDGRGSLRSAVTSVWGPKALEGVMDVQLDIDVEVDRVMAKREGLGESQTVKISGLVSTAQWGQGRSSPDRQYFYVNGRPCDLPKVARAVNEVYRSFNTHQLPVVVLDFIIPRTSVDVNVSPDKRIIFLHSEGQLIESLRTALEEFWQPSRSSYAVSGASHPVKAIKQSLLVTTVKQASDLETDVEVGSEDDLNEDDDGVDSAVLVQETNTKTHGVTISPEPGRSSRAPSAQQIILDEEEEDGESELSQPPTPAKRTSPQASGASPPSKRVVRTLQTSQAVWSPDRKSKRVQAVAGPGPQTTSSRAKLRQKLAGYASQGTAVPDDDLESDDEVVQVQASQSETPGDQEDGHASDDEPMFVVSAGSHGADQNRQMLHSLENGLSRTGRHISGPIFADEGNDDTATEAGQEDLPEPAPIPASSELGSDEGPRTVRAPLRSSSSGFRSEISSSAISGEVSHTFKLARLRARYIARRRNTASQTSSSTDAFTTLRNGSISSAAGFQNRDAASAEAALNRVISKVDFDQMEVLGQFNKGFIIARLRARAGESTPSDDLFIVDQHASDEKFNFETLQRTTVIKAQTLIKPRPVQLTAGDEITAIENLEVLRSNGFEVQVNNDALPGRGERVLLTAMPVSKETTFDVKDLEQLLHLLSEGAGPSARCTKARAMFAMRACRKSVMIGKALNKPQMTQLLRNMGTIDQPWNCPHGRPTMRHMVKVEPTRSRTDEARIDWASWSAARVG